MRFRSVMARPGRPRALCASANADNRTFRPTDSWSAHGRGSRSSRPIRSLISIGRTINSVDATACLADRTWLSTAERA